MPQMMAALIVVVALVMIIAGQTIVAQGQLRLGSLDAALTAERSQHSQTVLEVAALETPSRISSAASSLQLSQPKKILQLPMVSLDTPLPAIRIVGGEPGAGT
jgi:cell division protein FtsL